MTMPTAHVSNTTLTTAQPRISYGMSTLIAAVVGLASLIFMPWEGALLTGAFTWLVTGLCAGGAPMGSGGPAVITTSDQSNSWFSGWLSGVSSSSYSAPPPSHTQGMMVVASGTPLPGALVVASSTQQPTQSYTTYAPVQGSDRRQVSQVSTGSGHVLLNDERQTGQAAPGSGHRF